MVHLNLIKITTFLIACNAVLTKSTEHLNEILELDFTNVVDIMNIFGLFKNSSSYSGISALSDGLGSNLNSSNFNIIMFGISQAK